MATIDRAWLTTGRERDVKHDILALHLSNRFFGGRIKNAATGVYRDGVFGDETAF